MNLKLQLKILSFLQFCLWGSWLTTLGSYMFVTLKFDGAAIGAVYSSLGIAAVLMPTLLGIVADKWISAKWVYAICHLVGALTLYLAAQVTTPGEMFLVILLNSLAYMPTLGLINTISTACSRRGWILSPISRQFVSGAPSALSSPCGA